MLCLDAWARPCFVSLGRSSAVLYWVISRLLSRLVERKYYSYKRKTRSDHCSRRLLIQGHGSGNLSHRHVLCLFSAFPMSTYRLLMKTRAQFFRSCFIFPLLIAVGSSRCQHFCEDQPMCRDWFVPQCVMQSCRLPLSRGHWSWKLQLSLSCVLCVTSVPVGLAQYLWRNNFAFEMRLY